MSASTLLLSFLRIFRRVIRLVLLVPFLGFLVLFGLQFSHPPKWDTWWWVVQLRQWGTPILDQLDSWFEWPAATRYYALAMAIVSWVVRTVVDVYVSRAHRVLRRVDSKLRPDRANPTPPVNALFNATPRIPPAEQPPLNAAPAALGTILPDSEQAREELLKRYRRIEQVVKASKQKRCTFLAVAPVGLAEMKAGEPETAVAARFQAYEEMLKRILKQYSAWKQTWTPEEVVVCFLHRELAVGAAQRILEGVHELNTTQDGLESPFRVRCGLNEGQVLLDEGTALDAVADPTIDLARQIKKQSAPNRLWLSGDTYTHLQDKSGFRPLKQEVNGHKVYEWCAPLRGLEARRSVEEPPPPAVPASALRHEGGITQRVGRYEVLEELGRGTMGAVYKASDPQIGRTVAVKIILTANLPAKELQEYKQRFYREARVAGQMAHPGIVTIHDMGEDKFGQPYLVMEYVEGIPLDKLVSPPVSASDEGIQPTEGPTGGPVIQVTDALDIAIQVAGALNYAHSRGVIHRDIKPANILITPEGVAKILDFGIAQLGGTKLTQAGRLVGTPAFMSPEQFVGGAMDARSDIFSLGTVLYWLCTGLNPFAADTLTATAYKVTLSTHPPARELNPTLPENIDFVFSRCLAKNPDERYPTGRAFADDLEALKAGRPVAAALRPLL